MILIPFKKKRFIRLITALGAALMLVITLPGCIRPYPWPVFEPPPLQESARTVPREIYPMEDEDPEPATDPGLPAALGTTIDLSLDQALFMALETNPGIQVARYNPVLAGLAEKIEQGKFDPELFSELSYARERTRQRDSVTGAWERDGEEGQAASVGIAQTLPSGTDIELGLGHRRSQEFQTPEEQQMRMGMTLTQSLLQGFGSRVNLASIYQARLNTRISIHELRGITQALLADTERAYWDHLLALQEIQIFENSLDLATKQLSEVEQRIEIGTLPPIESAAARVEVALRKQDLIDAKSRFEERRLRLLFYILSGRKGQYDLTIQTTTPALADPEPQEPIADHLQLADQFRSDLQEARLRLSQNRLEIVKTRNGLLPRLDLFITLVNSVYADSFSDSFRAMNDSTYDLSAGIRISRSLGNQVAEARDLAAKTTLKQGKEALKNLEQIIERDLRIALNTLDRIRQQIGATRKTRLLQEESVTAEQARFEVGTSTGLLVAQAQRDLLASHIREVQAVINYRKAQVDFYLAEGSLLERRGVNLPAD